MSASRTRTTRSKPSPAMLGQRDDYWTLSTRPLHSLVVLLPLIVIYELGALFFLRDVRTGMNTTIAARKILAQFFDTFGVFGLMFPGLAMLSVLLTWHIVSKDRWRLRPMVLVGMVLEGALWALPLIVFAALVHRAMPAAVIDGAADLPALVAMHAAAGPTNFTSEARIVISLGAGLYEELLFRLVAIGLLHLLVKDLLQGSENAAKSVAIIGSAMAFALYHPVTATYIAPGTLSPQSQIQWANLIFYFGAGLFFACLYLFRGFGVVVYAHAIYDVMALVILSPRSS